MNDNKDNNYTLDIAHACKGIRYTCLVLFQQKYTEGNNPYQNF